MEQDRTGIETLAGALTQTAGGLQLDPARTPEEWLQGYAWAMVLDDNGEVLWQYDLPAELNKCYSVRNCFFLALVSRGLAGALLDGKNTACWWQLRQREHCGNIISAAVRP